MEIKNGTKILLTQEDAETFIAFKNNHEKFLTLFNSGVFDLDFGKVEINVHDGYFQVIHINRLVYKKGSDNIKIEIGRVSMEDKVIK